MAYYQKESELPRNFMGTIFLGSGFINEQIHKSIMESKEIFRDIVNDYTVDLKGVPSRQVFSCSIGMSLCKRGEDLTLSELNNSDYVTYYLNCFSDGRVSRLSSAESVPAERKLNSIFNKIIKGNRNGR